MHLKKVQQVRWFAKLVLHTFCERVEKQTFINTMLSERKIKREFKKKGTITCLPHPWQMPQHFCFIFAHAPVIAVAFLMDVIRDNVDSVDSPDFCTKHTKCTLRGWISRNMKPVLLTKEKRQVEQVIVLVVVEVRLLSLGFVGLFGVDCRKLSWSNTGFKKRLMYNN